MTDPDTSKIRRVTVPSTLGSKAKQTPPTDPLQSGESPKGFGKLKGKPGTDLPMGAQKGSEPEFCAVMPWGNTMRTRKKKITFGRPRRAKRLIKFRLASKP
jgi:hypothetical protein